MSESPTLAGLPIQRPKKSRFRLLKRLLLLFLVVIVLLIIAGYLLQNLIGNLIFDGLVSEMSAELGTEVQCEKVEFTWKNGFALTGFRIANPEGFGPTAALEVESAKMDMRITSMLSGTYELRGKLVAPEIEIRKDRDGKSNWEQLAENQRRGQAARGEGGSGPKRPRQVKVTTGDGGDTSLAEVRDQLRSLDLDFSIEKGKVQFVDEQQGERHAIEQLQLKLRASPEKQGALFHLGGILTGASQAKTSEISLVATFPLEGSPTVVFKAPDGIRLQDYRGLVSPFLEQDFESFAGLLRGEIRLAYQEDPAALEVEGHLRVEDLDVVGGPMGQGIGIRTTLWSMDPTLSLELQGGEQVPDLQGTKVDLGFLKLSIMSPESARQLLTKESQTEAKGILGMKVTLDLEAMGKQILHPAINGYSGKVTLNFAVDPAIQDKRLLPLVCVYQITGLKQDKEITGKDFVLPPDLQGSLVMDIVGGEEIGIGPIREEINAPGLSLRATLEDAMSAASKGKVRIDLDPVKAGSWLSPNLPTGLVLHGKSQVELDLIGGKLGEGFPLLIEGKILNDGLSYEGNRLDKGHYKIHYAKGRLDIDTAESTTLNKGPMRITAKVEGLDKPDGDMYFSFRTQWKEGVAAWGLTPYLQYAFPFLAGLDIQKGAKLAKLDYRSFANLDLELAGKIPADGNKLTEAMKLWSGKGKLTLKDGSFTPSQAFAGLMKLFGTKDKLNFRQFTNGFEISEGRLNFKEAKIGGGDGHLILRGNTTLDGKLDINVDFTDLLSRHRDGQRVLAAACGKPIMAHMGGTLVSPDFPIQNLISDLFTNAIKGGVKDLLKDIQKGKKPEDSLKDWFKKLKGK